eukprot:CAMPEP_0204192374 /NCGR_PEP_ID=MMETSP0361-20130328/60824_1 /ASSEMBLY_ACC=CAM_ASM_000343 /TAXON_ID=268821 /ORGANISM="Scrippsiella Hangoei, Strain SHTV-5" /LENGTH=39 /DNA_ID= /DNA_START= /DNA_END= /DNA_ORIENTATION=
MTSVMGAESGTGKVLPTSTTRGSAADIALATKCGLCARR